MTEIKMLESPSKIWLRRGIHRIHHQYEQTEDGAVILLILFK